jgi:ferredoxin--NADP+ reductase
MRESRVNSVTLLGRRGPVQAAFTTPELRELGELESADVMVDPTDLALDDHSRAALEDEASPTTKRNIGVLQDFAARDRDARRPRTIALRFLRSPVEIVGDGRVEGVVVAINELALREDGTLAARPTGQTEMLPAGLVLSSIGYRGRPVTGLPFDEARGLIPNHEGRVVGREREYVTGWIKRGPSGIIGTNKKCAQATVQQLLADLSDPRGERPSAQVMADWLHDRQPRLVTGEHWAAIDAHERGLGARALRPRVKLTRVAELLAVGHGV